MLKNSRGRYLLARRNPKKYPDVKEQWDIIGGRIESGTPLIDNLKREIMEEVGLKYQGEPELISAQDIIVDHKYTDATNHTNESKHVVRLTYIGEMDGDPKIDEDHTEAKWFTGEEIKQLENLDGYFKELIEKGLVKL